MADFLANLLAFPPEKKVSAKEWDKNAVEYVKGLAGVTAQTWAKPVDKQNILDLLNPSVNTLAYLFALCGQLQFLGKDKARIDDALNRSVIFFTSFDPTQARYAGEAWRSLLEWALDAYPKLGVQDFTPITTAMLRLDPTAGTFTSSHLRLVRMCMEVGVPSQALPILDKTIYSYPQPPPKNLPEDLLCEIQSNDFSSNFITPKSGLTFMPLKSEYILEYYLLGAHIYLGLHSYSRARLFLEYVLLYPSPSHACSALQVEAYKKYILLGLLAQGKSYGLPRTHDPQAMRSIRACGKAYEALLDCFEKREWSKFQAEVEVGMSIWSEDGNLRFVKEVSDALLRYRVLDLQKTFATLPVSRVAANLRMSADQTLRLLEEMIRQTYLHATITPSATSAPGDAVLHFTQNQHEESSQIDLEDQTKRIESLINYLHDADRRLQLSKEYVDYQKRSKRMAGPDGDLADQMDLTWDAPIAGLAEDNEGEGDEDIMAA